MEDPAEHRTRESGAEVPRSICRGISSLTATVLINLIADTFRTLPISWDIFTEIAGAVSVFYQFHD